MEKMNKVEKLALQFKNFAIKNRSNCSYWNVYEPKKFVFKDTSHIKKTNFRKP